MTYERAIDIGTAAAAAGGTTFVALGRGSGMDQWVMWGLSTVVAMASAFAAFRLTTESRLKYVETRLEHTATKVDVANLQGDISRLGADLQHRREVMDRMDKRLEAMAARMGVM